MRRYRGKCVYLAIGCALAFYGHFSPRHRHAPNDIACVVYFQTTICRRSLLPAVLVCILSFLLTFRTFIRSTRLLFNVHHVVNRSMRLIVLICCVISVNLARVAEGLRLAIFYLYLMSIL